MSDRKHSIDQALNIDLLPAGFVQAMQKAWCEETCWPGCAADYPADRDSNPSFGNCLVTTLAAWAARGFTDDVIPSKVDETAWHFRLGAYHDDVTDPRMDRHGTIQIDPTWQQFEDGAVFRELNINTPAARAEYKEVIDGSFWQDESLVSRLQILLDRMETEGGYKSEHSAAQIVGRLQDEYQYVHRAGFVKGRQNPGAPILRLVSGPT